jgi:hypothetical protein
MGEAALVIIIPRGIRAGAAKAITTIAIIIITRIRIRIRMRIHQTTIITKDHHLGILIAKIANCKPIPILWPTIAQIRILITKSGVSNGSLSRT